MPRTYKVDTAFCDAQVAPFRRAFCGGVGKELSFRNGRLDIKALARKDTMGCFTRKAVTPTGIPVTTDILDCSGSMSGDPIRQAVQLAAIKSRLHRMGLIDARIICSGYGHEPTKRYGECGFSVPMPQPDWVWERMSARHGQEGLSQTFKLFQSDLAESDIVTCYTDCDISDSGLEPSLWRRHGISCVGLYCGYVGQVDVLQRYFDNALVRTNKEDLFHSYLALVARLLRIKHES